MRDHLIVVKNTYLHNVEDVSFLLFFLICIVDSLCLNLQENLNPNFKKTPNPNTKKKCTKFPSCMSV